jgi:hypothetical protein
MIFVVIIAVDGTTNEKTECRTGDPVPESVLRNQILALIRLSRIRTGYIQQYNNEGDKLYLYADTDTQLFKTAFLHT